MRLVPVVALFLALSSNAQAKKNEIPDIKKTGIEEFDPTFMKVKAIHDDLDAIHASLKGSNQSLASALNLPKSTSLDDSLAELQKRAGKKINRTLEDGQWPKLEASDAVPSDVAAGIDAVNSMVDNLKSSYTTLKDMPEASKAVISSAQKLPSKLSLSTVTDSGLGLADYPKVWKKVRNNAKAVKATPERIERVTDQTMNMANKVTKTFP